MAVPLILEISRESMNRETVSDYLFEDMEEELLKEAGLEKMNKYAFEFAGQNLVSLVSGCLYWPDEKVMVVSDLHLEKGSDFLKVGRFVPPYDSCETLTRLRHDLDNNEVETLILLGDTVHDPQGFARLDRNCIDMFEEICKRYRVIWIIGNHEKGLCA